MKVDQYLLDEIVRRVLSVASPARIILFGSTATGEKTPDSDIDLLILESKRNDPREERKAIRYALFGVGRPVDLMIMTTAQYERSKDVIGGIAWPAATSGKVIYEAA